MFQRTLNEPIERKNLRIMDVDTSNEYNKIQREISWSNDFLIFWNSFNDWYTFGISATIHKSKL